MESSEGGMRQGWPEKPVTQIALRYILAVAFVCVAAALRAALPDVLKGTPFLAFYPAVVAAAMFGGFGPGVLATFGSILCYALWFYPAPSRHRYGRHRSGTAAPFCSCRGHCGQLSSPTAAVDPCARTVGKPRS